ncbi:peptidoglycan DD-metalloendopeptidase family protein [Pontiellaceae bacterium B12219]|nr:peptidoglycan DD-metalloendopeptidase family protein [Pontiellaceae bacterium B12219]
MNTFSSSLIMTILLGWAYVSVAETRKKNISIGEARRELGVVAAYQNFPERYRIDRLVVLKAEGEYYHVYLCYLKPTREWRTLVYSNSGDYLGYYETIDPPVATDKDALIFPAGDYSAASGDFSEGDYDSGNVYTIRFGADGPPDEVKFEDRTFTFVSSPRRIRPENPAYRFFQLANRVAASVNAGRYKNVRDDFSEEALNRISEEQTVAILRGLRSKFGRIDRVGDPWVQSETTGVMPITFERSVAGLKLTLSDDDKIQGMWMLPFKTAFPEIGAFTTDLRLPFEGQWRVLWGGDARDQSKFFGSRVSHNALEFVVSNRFGKTFVGEGTDNEDYFAFGKTVRAPAAGTVVAVINGVEDNQPRAPNPFDRLGNAVMIEHGTNEYSVVGHLMNKSITVRVGERVVAGVPIGRCGNSGDSSQPSVYFHLQDSGSLLAGSGYKPVFKNLYVRKDGKTTIVPELSPERGGFVQQRSVPLKKAAPAGEGRQTEE